MRDRVALGRPGSHAISSAHLRTRAELRRCSPAGHVSDMPLGIAACLSGRSHRSMADALIPSTWPSASTSSSSPLDLSAATHWSNMALMYVPHGMPTNSHNRSSNRCAASSYFGLRPRPGPGPSFALAACESRRRAVDRPMPTATKRSSTSPFYFLLPLAHSALNLFARRFLVAKSSPPSIRPSIHPKPDQAMRDFALTIYDKQTKITRSNITTNVDIFLYII